MKSGLDGKANSSHTHSISQITNLQSTLDGKANVNHSHSEYMKITTLTANVIWTGNSNYSQELTYTLPQPAINELLYVDWNGGKITHTRSGAVEMKVYAKLPSSGKYVVMIHNSGSGLIGYDSDGKEIKISGFNFGSLSVVSGGTIVYESSYMTLHKGDSVDFRGLINIGYLRIE